MKIRDEDNVDISAHKGTYAKHSPRANYQSVMKTAVDDDVVCGSDRDAT